MMNCFLLVLKGANVTQFTLNTHGTEDPQGPIGAILQSSYDSQCLHIPRYEF
jgi:hypothetical protein